MTEEREPQSEIGRALRRARSAEDRALAGRVREEGERLARSLAGVLALARLHALDNRAFDQPLRELGATLGRLFELLGPVHLLTVEQLVYVNDVRIRLEGTDVGGQLGARLGTHHAGGLSFHDTLSDSQVRALVATLSHEPASQSPLAALTQALKEQGLDKVEALGIHRFRIGQENAPVPARGMAAVARDAVLLTEETWLNLSAGRLPNPLPLRRLVCEMIELDPGEPTFWREAGAADGYPAHLLRVAKVALLLGRALGLAADALQDLGVAALFHDVGYAAPALSPDEQDAARDGALLRHPVAGAALLARQRGFHEAKVRRLRATLEHHRRYDDPRGRPALLARILALAEDYDTLMQARGGGLSPQTALARLAAGGGSVYDPLLVQLLVNALGASPPGTLLKLADGRTGRVVSLARDQERFGRPVVAIACTADGYATRGDEIVDLAGDGAPTVEGVVDPAEAANWRPMPEPPPPPEPEQKETAPEAEAGAGGDRPEGQAAEAAAAASVPAPAGDQAAAGDSSARPLYQGVLPTVLRDLYLSRATGVLHLTRRAERRSVRIWKGNVIHASSNLKEDHLGEVAVREGLITQADLERANQVTSQQKKRLGVVLRELGILDEERLENALAAHAREVIVKAFAWTDGYADFEEQEAEPSWFAELALRLSTPDLILEAIRRIDDPDVVRYHLGNIDRVLRLAQNPAAKGMRVSLAPLDGYVLSRVDGRLSAREVMRIVPGDPPEVMRSLFGLICVGIVEYAPPDEAPGAGHSG